MAELTHLISRLQGGLERKASYLQTIRHPQLLISSLQELNILVGNSKVKDSVATQVSHLIMTRRRTSKKSSNEDEVMLNTVLYGPPGVGKTLIGTKLAKIWYALGYLSNEKASIQKSEPTPSFRDLLQGPGGSESVVVSTDKVVAYVFLLLTLIYLLVKIYDSGGAKWLLGAIAAFAALAVWIAYYLLVPTKKKEPSCPVKETSATSKFSFENSIIRVVTRADFVDKYVGWTAIKTNKLLEDNLGRVLFVDEAYSLQNGPQDGFGMEALTTLNLFLSQHPGEIIVIFAGYKDLLESGAFAVQPGLERRFMWQFACEGYSPSELFSIFQLQVRKKGWTLSDQEGTESLFSQHADAFPNFGGDTERVVFFAELEHSRDFINEPASLKISTLEKKHIAKGIEKLRENNMRNRPSKPSTNPFANIMKMMSQVPKKEEDKIRSSDKSEEEIIEAVREASLNKAFC